jgi:nucleoside-diphosphate-sugar epimerase
VRLAEGELGDGASVERAMPDGVDAVFHVAASTSLWRLRNAEQARVNVGGTRVVVEAALRRGASRLVHTSSTAAYGFHDRPIDESTPREGGSSWVGYLRTKALAEDEVRRGMTRGLDAVILNPGHVIGRYDRGNWSRVIAMIATERLPGVPSGSGSFAHGREVARAHVEAAEHGRSGANYLLGGVDATFVDLARCIGEVTGRAVPGRATPAVILRALARLSLWWSYVTRREPELTPEGVAIATHDLVCRSDRARHELGYREVPLKVMVEDCYRWMVDEGLV